MQVFRTIYERLLRTGVVAASQIHVPAELVSRDVLALAHCPAYVDAFCAGALPADAMRRIGFPWSPELVERTLAEVSGTLLTAELALRHGLACNTAGGTHHAHRAEGRRDAPRTASPPLADTPTRAHVVVGSAS